jgi:allophanate hydrolase
VSLLSPSEAVEASLERIAADGRDGVWITVVPAPAVRAAADEVERRLAAGEQLPLAGRTLAVKDNIDVAGLPTTAGCPAYAYEPEASARVVEALVAAGAVVMGKTNMDQFATGLVGTRSPYGVCPNAHWDGLVSGGSSSGSAVAVAAGLVDLALGTDTAGSGRVPAAANGIVGLKPTRGRLSAAGVVPACQSIDCVSIFARTVAEAAEAAALAAVTSPDPRDPWTRVIEPARLAHPGRVRLGVPSFSALEAIDCEAGSDEVGRFAVAVDEFAAHGLEVDLVEIDLDPFLAAGRLLYGGAFVAERYAAVGAFVEQHRDEVDPVVASIVLAAGQLPGWQVFESQTELRRLAACTAVTWAAVDLVALPTVARIPTVAEVLADPIDVNARLGTYTMFANLLDLAVLAMPVGAPDLGASGPPTSVSLMGPAGADDLLVAVGARLVDRQLSERPTSARSPRPGRPAIRRIG